MSAVNEISKHELRGTSPWLSAPPAAGEDADLGSLGFPSVVPCYSFCAGFGSHRHAGLGALRRGGPPWRARVSGCGAGAPRACAPQTAVLRAPLPLRPRVPDLTPAPARSRTALRSCQFSRLSAELLVSDRKQRGGAKAARQGERARKGSLGAPQGRGRWRSQGARPQGQAERPRAGSFWVHPSPRAPLLTFSLLAASPPFSGLPFPYSTSAATRFVPAALFEDRKKEH